MWSYFSGFYVDFKGQKLADQLYHQIITVAAIVSTLYAYYYQRVSFAVYGIMAAFLLSSLICVIPWWFYRRNPLNWQKVRIAPPKDPIAGTENSTGGVASDSKLAEKSKRKK